MSGASQYVKRALEFQFTLATGEFVGSPGNNSISVKGLRAAVRVRKDGGPGLSYADVRIFGLSPSIMNRLSTLGRPPYMGNNNLVTIKAGNSGGAMSVVFFGDIGQAWVDAAGVPEVALALVCYTGGISALQPAPPTSYAGAVDAATVIAGIAEVMHWTFENNGVSVMLPDAYYPGSPKDQAWACARDANINISLDDPDPGVLAIWPKGGSRSGKIPLISPDTGLIGRPTYAQDGCIIMSSYNPAIRLGGQIQIQSELQNACGTWPVVAVNHDLESEMPDGAWFTRTTCVFYGWPNGFVPTVPQNG